MVILGFPPPEHADRHGLLAIGGDLEPPTLLYAYRNGIFPWPTDDVLLTWFSPPERGVLFFDDLHVPRSVKKAIRKGNFSCSFNSDFEQVIRSCAAARNRSGQHGTWIAPTMVKAYTEFHRKGYAHSVECYVDGCLAGGLYGVAVGKLFAGESMFYHRSDASRAALLYLLYYLKKQGVSFMDCQMVTELLSSFGATEIKRHSYLRLISAVIDAPEIKLPVKEPEPVTLDMINYLTE